MKARWKGLWPTGVILLVAQAAPQAALAQAAGAAPERLYNEVCAFCHSRSLPPFPSPELRGRNLPPETITHFVRTGPGAMPPFSLSHISDEDLARLSAWIAASPAPPKPAMPPTPPARGAKP